MGILGGYASTTATPIQMTARVQMVHYTPVLVAGVWGLEPVSPGAVGALKTYSGVVGLDTVAAGTTGRTVLYDRVGACAGLA